jgi:hypothetical protein
VTLAHVIDGVTELDSALFNPMIDAINASTEADEQFVLASAGVANVIDFGAVGDYSTDDTVAIQDAIDSGAAGVFFPEPSSAYRVTSALVPVSNQRWFSPAGFQYAHEGSGNHVRILRETDGAIVEGDTIAGWSIQGLMLTGSGNAAHTNAIGIELTTASWCEIDRCMFNNFGAQAVKWNSGVGLQIHKSFATNCVLNRSGHSDYIGVFELSGADPFVAYNEIAASASAIGTGYIAALLADGPNGFYTSNVVEISEVGLAVTANGYQNSFVANRSDLNYGHGFVVDGAENIFTANRAFRNSRATDNTYDGFNISRGQNIFNANHVGQISGDEGGGGKQQRYGFNDSSSGITDDIGNIYLGNYVSQLIGTAAYSVTDTESQVINFQTRTANADTSGALLADLETEVNQIKALLRTQGLLKA